MPISKGGKGAPLFVCLIDFEKAFDKVDRKLIWLRLEEAGINGKCLEAIKAMYNNVTHRKLRSMVNWVKALTRFMVSSKATRLVPICSVL